MINPDCPDSNNTFSAKTLSLGLKGHYTSAVVDLTSRCNASCTGCFIADNSTSDLSLESIKFILDKLATEPIINITFTGGEIFMRSDIIDILQYAIQKDFWRITLFTNGTLITDDQIRFLCNHKDYIQTIQMSVFSSDSKINDSIMGIDNSIEKITTVSRKLKDSGIHIIFAINILEANMNDYEKTIADLHDFCSEFKTGVSRIVCNCQHTHSSEISHFYSQVLHKSQNLLRSEKKRIQESYKNMALLSDQIFCNGIYTTINIDSTGNLRPCTAFRNITVGSIFESGSIFEITQKNNALQNLKNLRKDSLAKCLSCAYKNYCSLCIGLSHTETGSLSHPSTQYCNYAESVYNTPLLDKDKG